MGVHRRHDRRDRRPPRRRVDSGAALGVQAAAAGLATAVGSALGGVIAGVAGYLPTFSLGAGLVFVGLAGVLVGQ
ncbi:hypothetical protein ACFQFH_09740 [Halobaculum halobium]|uniref:Major facilitator superfamily (MFS) profile domain-containing protein n=1 Tax=Halobaculum halobium TaxID=3032281 RepID=A0ABD5TDQ8_9EURY|nr:hypothetical protein [Halobaculum sp. SYNS20]